MGQSMDTDNKDREREESSGGVYQGKKSIWRGVSGDGEEDGMAV